MLRDSLLLLHTKTLYFERKFNRISSWLWSNKIQSASKERVVVIETNFRNLVSFMFLAILRKILRDLQISIELSPLRHRCKFCLVRLCQKKKRKKYRLF